MLQNIDVASYKTCSVPGMFMIKDDFALRSVKGAKHENVLTQIYCRVLSPGKVCTHDEERERERERERADSDTLEFPADPLSNL